MNSFPLSDVRGSPQNLFDGMGQSLVRLGFHLQIRTRLLLAISSIPHVQKCVSRHQHLRHAHRSPLFRRWECPLMATSQTSPSTPLWETCYLFLSARWERFGCTPPLPSPHSSPLPPTCQPVFDLHHMVIIREERLAVNVIVSPLGFFPPPPFSV